MAGKSATAREDMTSLRTIGEVAEHLGLPQHVLRFWETRFREIDPVKRAGGRRYYRPRDIELVETIRHLLYREGYTIKGVQRILKEQGVEAVVADVRRRRTGESPAPAAPPAPDAARVEPEPPQPAPEPPPFTAQGGESTEPESAPAHRGGVPALPEKEPVFQAPVVVTQPSDEAQAQRLREVLAELEECKRLLNVTRRSCQTDTLER